MHIAASEPTFLIQPAALVVDLARREVDALRRAAANAVAQQGYAPEEVAGIKSAGRVFHLIELSLRSKSVPPRLAQVNDAQRALISLRS